MLISDRAAMQIICYALIWPSTCYSEVLRLARQLRRRGFTSTLFGAFKIDQTTGAQVSHRTVLIRWADEEPIAIQTQAQATQPTTLKAG
jgi:hypothetical protein